MEFVLQYPGHREKALTFSYDDGQRFDRRLVALFNRYGLKGTFHLNSGWLGGGLFVEREELASLYAGHEVACHGVHHAFPTHLPQEKLVEEFLQDRLTLEEATGRIIRGCSYAFGEYDGRVVGALRTLGFSYSRTTQATNGFALPREFLTWHPSCHHSAALSGDIGERFLNLPAYRHLALLYIWGHSYEFDRDGNWAEMERLCACLSGHEEIWYATNQEIVDYVTAARSLIFSADGKRVQNPTATRICALVDGRQEEF